MVLLLLFLILHLSLGVESRVSDDDDDQESSGVMVSQVRQCQQSCRDNKYKDILTITPDYNHHLPPQSQLPITVNFSINLRNVLEVNEVGEKVSLETTLRMYWKDERIALNFESLPESFFLQNKSFISLHPDVANMIWIPDIFIDQAVSLRKPQFQVPAASLRVYRDGTIRYSTRVNYDVACSMDFHFYPHDVQKCYVRFESFGYTSHEMEIKWNVDDCNVNGNISLAQFDVFTHLVARLSWIKNIFN